MGRASGGSNTPHWIKNNILDLLRAMSVKIAIEILKLFISVKDVAWSGNEKNIFKSLSMF